MRRQLVLGAFVVTTVMAGCTAKERDTTTANPDGGAGGTSGGEGGSGSSAGVGNGGASGDGGSAGDGGTGASVNGGASGMGGDAGSGAGGAGASAGNGGTSSGGAGAGGIGGTSGAGAGGVGGAPECTPTETEPCYGGPVSTEGVGRCKAGNRTCTTASTWGSCQGQVLPGVESCADASVDENCDGFECGIWGASFAGFEVRRAAADGDGGVVLMGTFTSTAIIGGTTYLSQGGTDVALVRLDAQGGVDWVRTFGTGDGDGSWTLAVGPNGEVYTVIQYGNPTQMGGQFVFNRKLEALDRAGASLWSKALPRGDWNGLTASSQGKLLLTGAVSGSLDLDGTTLSGDADAFVVQLKTDGTLEWAKVYPNAGNETGYFAETDGSGNVVVVGTLEVASDFGRGTQNVYGSGDIFVLRLNPQGGFLNSTVFGSTGYEEPTGLAVDPAGGVVVMGFFDNDLKGLGIVVKSLVPADQTFVVHLSPGGASFGTDWGVVAPSVDTTGAIQAIRADAEGGAVFVGRTYNNAGFDGQTFPGDVGVLVATDNFGKHRWSRVLGGPSGRAQALAQSANGELTVAGVTGSATIDLGSGPIQAGSTRTYAAHVGH